MLAAVALTFDSWNRARAFSLPGTGLLDEPAHFATAALALAALRPHLRMSRSFVAAALAMSVLIDLDHMPLYLGFSWISPEPDGRPASHSAAVVVLLLAIAPIRRLPSAVLAGAALGLATHLVRDICEGEPGVSLWWPLTSRNVVAGPIMFWILILSVLAVALAPLQTHVTEEPDPIT
jgi:inner membrane protein